MSFRNRAGGRACIDPMRHVLIFAHGSGRGGAEYCLDTALRNFDLSAWRVTVFFPAEGPMAESARKMGISVQICTSVWWMCEEMSLWYVRKLFGAFWRVRQLAQWIKENHVDIVYSNTAVIFEGAMAARLAGVPHIWHIHEVMKGRHLRISLLPVSLITRLIGKLSERVIFESNSAQAVCKAYIPEWKSLRVYTPVRATEEEDEGRSKARQRFGLNEHHCVVAWVGRLSLRKNPLLLVRAIPHMKRAAEASFLMAGQGPLRDETTYEIARLGLEDRCQVIPFQNDIWSLLRASDILVLTSDEESFGLVLVEAGACERPVVATRTQGPSEIVVDGGTGFLIEPGNEIELAQRLDQLIADIPLREKMGKAAAVRVNELFSARKHATRIQEVFEEVVRKPESAPNRIEGTPALRS